MGLDAIREPPETAASFGVRAADPVIGHLDHKSAVLPGDRHGGRARLSVLADIRQALRDHVVRGNLDRLIQASVEIGPQRDRDGGLRDQGVQRDLEAVAADHSRMEAAGNSPQLLERGGDLTPRLVDLRLGVGIISDALLQPLQVE